MARTGQELAHKYQFYLDFKENFADLDIRTRAKSLNQSALIIHGAEDEAVHFSEAMRLAKWIPEFRVKNFTTGRAYFWRQAPI